MLSPFERLLLDVSMAMLGGVLAWLALWVAFFLVGRVSMVGGGGIMDMDVDVILGGGGGQETRNVSLVVTTVFETVGGQAAKGVCTAVGR